MKTTYEINDREAGNNIEICNSIEDAERVVAEYEATDRADGNYTPDFYEIVQVSCRSVNHDEIIASVGSVSGGGESGEESIAIGWPNASSTLEDINGDSVPREWRNIEELRAFLINRVIIETSRSRAG